MDNIKIDNIEYMVIDNYREAFNQENFESKYTDYFKEFDYILGDYAYDKLRLKGFYDSDNENAIDINNIRNKEKYLKEFCVFNCKYFLLKKFK